MKYFLSIYFDRLTGKKINSYLLIDSSLSKSCQMPVKRYLPTVRFSLVFVPVKSVDRKASLIINELRLSCLSLLDGVFQFDRLEVTQCQRIYIYPVKIFRFFAKTILKIIFFYENGTL